MTESNTPAVRWRTPEQVVHESLEQEVAELRAALRAFLATDPSFMRANLSFVEQMAKAGNRLAPVVLQARRALGEA